MAYDKLKLSPVKGDKVLVEVEVVFRYKDGRLQCELPRRSDEPHAGYIFVWPEHAKLRTPQTEGGR